MVKSAQALHRLADELEAEAERRRLNRLLYFRPHPKQQEFLDMGSYKRERLLIAGNQTGKSETGAYETALHLTGLYPPDWMGYRFDRPTVGWAAGETGSMVRDVQQTKLCGMPGLDEYLGTGLIPRHLFVGKPSLARGVTDAYDTIWVRHVSGGVSSLSFKSYEQGRQKFQGKTLDFAWEDEEPPEEVHSEIMARLTATNGISYLTFTPLLGMSKVVLRFLKESEPQRGYVQMGLKDALHLTVEARENILSVYPLHERDARLNGNPMLGSGKVFDMPLSLIQEDPIPFDQVPLQWAKLWGLDFGIGHPFAAVLLAWDKDRDVIHILHAIRQEGLQPIHHAAAIRAVAGAIPVAWPHDGNQRQKDTGQQLIHAYRGQGLLVLPTHSTFPDGGYSVERGVLDLYERATTNRLKVGKDVEPWFQEWSLYHRKDGMLVKALDDVLDAGRCAYMMRRFARPLALGATRIVPTTPRQAGERRMARGLNFDLHMT